VSAKHISKKHISKKHISYSLFIYCGYAWGCMTWYAWGGESARDSVSSLIHLSHDSSIRAMTHSYVPRLIHTCHDSFIRVRAVVRARTAEPEKKQERTSSVMKLFMCTARDCFKETLYWSSFRMLFTYIERKRFNSILVENLDFGGTLGETAAECKCARGQGEKGG